jgi:hypothetical protein
VLICLVPPGNEEQGAVEGRPLTAGGDGLLFDAIDQVQGAVYRFRLATKLFKLKLRLQCGRLGTERPQGTVARWLLDALVKCFRCASETQHQPLLTLAQ